ncbi:MAG: leucine-rich repeat domain-containing protein [Ruminococcaceae bacterium]|nr:leucine-rich repeat domain-containing protein [Oscillospiraceae bacterium]
MCTGIRQKIEGSDDWMSRKKKLIVYGIMAVAVLALIAVAVFAVVKFNSMRGTCGEDVTWVYDGNGTLTISGRGAMKDYRYDDTPPYYRYSSEITNVVIEDGVTHIGSMAFKDFTYLKDVDIPDSVTSIGREAFAACTSLNSVTIPYSVTHMGYGAFQSCDSLEKVKILANITKIETATFEWCSSLRSAILPDSLTSIGEDAFSRCGSLTEVTIPENVKVIGKGAFNYCTSLNRITFLGDAPIIDETDYGSNWIFYEVTANAYYPPYNDTWDGYKAGSLGGDINWIAAPN